MSEKKLHFYSIQSVKGGVGKTTISLNLAQTILDARQEPSIIFDLDFCGTSISDMMTDEDHRPKKDYQFGNILLRNLLYNAKESRNLLSLFLDYLNDSPKTIPKIEPSDLNGIFLIPSGGFQPEFQTGNGEDQHLLFNENHAAWFCDFLFDQIETLRPKPDQNLHIIFDHAPGWSALCPLVEKWMLKIPDANFKYLVISSPDEMDIRLNATRICDLYLVYLSHYCTRFKFDCLLHRVGTQSENGPDSISLYDENEYMQLIDGAEWEDLPNEPEFNPDEPQTFIHLVINKSCHLEALGGKRVDLGKLHGITTKQLENTISKRLKDLKEERLPSTTFEQLLNKTKHCSRQATPIPFSMDLFFYYQNKTLAENYLSYVLPNTKNSLSFSFRTSESERSYTFNELCVQDAQLFSDRLVEDSRNSFLSDEDLDTFLHTRRLIRTFHPLFKVIVKHLGHTSDPKMIDELADHICESLDEDFFQPQKDLQYYTDELRYLVEKIFYRCLGDDERAPESREAYYLLIRDNALHLLKDQSFASILTILFTTYIFINLPEEAASYLAHLPNWLTTLFQSAKEDNETDFPEASTAFLNAWIGQDNEFVLTLESKEACLNMRTWTLSLTDLETKHRFVKAVRDELNKQNISEFQHLSIKQLLIILYTRYEYTLEQVQNHLNNYLKDPSVPPRFPIEIEIRSKFERLIS